MLGNLATHLDNYARDPWAVLRLTIRLSALCLLVSLTLSSNLWFQEGRDFLPSPFVPALAAMPHFVNQFLYALTYLCCLGLFIMPQWKRLGIILLPVFLYFVLQDQMRGQFYHVMFFFNLIAASLLPANVKEIEYRHLDPLRYMTIGVYFWGGFHKLSLYFAQELFPTFVSVWIPDREIARLLGMFVPFFELSIALFLLFPATVRIGQVMAGIMLAVVLLSLGPTGKNSAMNIWPVNVYLDCLALFLFHGKERPLLSFSGLKAMRMNLASCAIFLLLPVIGLLFNVPGSHPSLKLYCGCPGQPVAFLRFGEKENTARLSLKSGYQINKDRKLYASSLTHTSLHLTSSVVKAGAEPYIDGMKGFCAWALFPEDIVLVLREPASRWSAALKDTEVKLCDTP